MVSCCFHLLPFAIDVRFLCVVDGVAPRQPPRTFISVTFIRCSFSCWLLQGMSISVFFDVFKCVGALEVLFQQSSLDSRRVDSFGLPPQLHSTAD